MGNSQKSLALLRQKLAVNQSVSISGEHPDAAVLVALVQGSNELEIILTQRSQHLKLHPGESAFPGGKKEHQDKSLWHTALRESQEEISLSPHSVEYLGALDQQLTRTGFKVSPFVGWVSDTFELKNNPNEIDEIYTVPLSFFTKAEHLQITEQLYQKTLKKVPNFQCGPYHIRGVTALIIIDLLNTAFDAKITIGP